MTRWPDVLVSKRWSADASAVPGSVAELVCEDCGRYVITAPSSMEVLRAMAPAKPVVLCQGCALVPGRLLGIGHDS